MSTSTINISNLFMFLYFISLGSFATVLQAEPSQVVSDTSEVEVRQADPDRMAEYRTNPDFIYESQPEHSLTLIEMIVMGIFRFLDRIFDGETSGSVVRIIFLLLLIGAIILVLNQVLKGNIKHAFYGRSASDPIRFQRDPAEESKENLDNLIEQATTSGNYREAVRLIYQKSLGELSQAGLIEWATNKTNQEYIYEVHLHPVSDPFRKLTRIYDYTEYGDFGINHEGFTRVHEIYIRLSDLVRNNSASGASKGGINEQKG